MKKQFNSIIILDQGGVDMTRKNVNQAKAAGLVDVIVADRRQEAMLTAEALQTAIFNSANFSSNATDAKGVIQIFNAGAERMLANIRVTPC